MTHESADGGAGQRHCHTMEGPPAQNGLRALDTGNLALAMKWVAP